MSDKTQLRWFIAVGNNLGWGRSDKSEKQAIAYMQKNGVGKATAWTVWKCTEATEVDGLGYIVSPVGDPLPVCVQRHNTKA